MPRVVVRLPFGQPGTQRQQRSSTVQGLNLAFFIHAKYQGAIRRVEVQAHHVAHLLFELRIIGDLELLHAMRLYGITLPDALYHHAEIPSWWASTRTLQWVPSAGRVFRVVSKIFCSTSGVSTDRRRFRFCR